jgi:hypothetical protein
MAKYGEGDRVVLHPNVTGQHGEYEGRIGVVLNIEADVLHHHLGGVAQYRVRVENENSVVAISVSEKELKRARRDVSSS